MLKVRKSDVFPALCVCERSELDERVLNVAITEAGEQLKEKAVDIPAKMGGCVSLDEAEAKQLYLLLRKLLGAFGTEE